MIFDHTGSGFFLAYSADAIANYFLDKSQSTGVQVDHMKLQKLVYFAHGWHLGLFGKPLINEQIEAWEYGPVIRSLYREFKEFGNQPITTKAQEVTWRVGEGIRQTTPSITDGSPPDVDTVRELLDRIWSIFSGYSAIQLSNMTHAHGSPWHQVCSVFKHRMPKGLHIPNEAIREYFANLAAKQQA